MARYRFTCTKEEPYDRRKHGEACVHPDAVFVKTFDDGEIEYDQYECPYCKIKFKEPVPR